MIDDEGIWARNSTFSTARYFTWWEIDKSRGFYNYGFAKFIDISNKRGQFIGVSLKVSDLNGLIDDVVRCAGEDHVLSKELLKHREPKE